MSDLPESAEEFTELNEVLQAPEPIGEVHTTILEALTVAPEPTLDLSLAILTDNVNITPKVQVAIITPSISDVDGDTVQLAVKLKNHLTKFKVANRAFSDSFSNLALASMLRHCCIAVAVSGDKDLERKILASGRFVLRLSGTPSPCPYVKIINFKNLTHTIIDAQTQLCKRGTPQAIARYAVTGQPL